MLDHIPNETLIDCDACPVRGSGCAGCIVPLLLGERGGVIMEPPPGEFDAGERRALAVLADAGLIASVIPVIPAEQAS